MRVLFARVAATLVWAVGMAAFVPLVLALALTIVPVRAAVAQSVGEDEWGDSPREATPVVLPVDITLVRNKVGDQDWCSIELQRGQMVHFFDGSPTVLGPDGQPVVLLWDGSRNAFAAMDAGTYTVGVRYTGFSPALQQRLRIDNGGHQLAAATPFDQPGGVPQVIAAGVEVPVQMDFSGDVDLFDLPLLGDRILEVELRGPRMWLGQSSGRPALSLVRVEPALPWSPARLRPLPINLLAQTEWQIESDPQQWMAPDAIRFVGSSRLGADQSVRLRVSWPWDGQPVEFPVQWTMVVRDLGARPAVDQHPGDWRVAPRVELEQPIAFWANTTAQQNREIDYVRIDARAGHVYDLSARDSQQHGLVVRSHDGRPLYWYGNEFARWGGARCVQALEDGPLYIGVEWGYTGGPQVGIGGFALTVRDRGWWPPDRDTLVAVPGGPRPLVTLGTLGTRADIDTHTIEVRGAAPVFVTVVNDATPNHIANGIQAPIRRNARLATYRTGPDHQPRNITHVVSAIDPTQPASFSFSFYGTPSDSLPFIYRVISHRAGAVADIAGAGGAREPDGQFSADDLVVFVDALFAGDAWLADVTGGPQYLASGPHPDGQITTVDILVFVQSWLERR